MSNIKKMALTVIGWVGFGVLIASMFPNGWPSADAALLTGLFGGIYGGFIHYKIWGL